MWFALLAALALADDLDEQPCRWHVDAPPTVTAGATVDLSFTLNVPADHHVFREMMDVRVVSSGGLEVGEPVFPDPIIVQDPDFGPQLEYHGDVTVRVPVQVPLSVRGPVELVVELHHQGCGTEICHPPRETTQTVELPVSDDEPGVRVPVRLHVEPPAEVPVDGS